MIALPLNDHFAGFALQSKIASERPGDRIIGAALFAIEQGVDPMPIVKGIKAALKFDRAEDATAPEIQKALAENGIEYVLENYMGLKADESLYGMIKAEFEA